MFCNFCWLKVNKTDQISRLQRQHVALVVINALEKLCH